MNLAHRIKEILLNPKQAWPVIEAEQTDTPTLYIQYIMLLALVPTISVFVGNAISHPEQFSLLGGIVRMVVDYLLWMATMYLVALLADRLAPNFQGQRNPIAALKLSAYSSTAGMLGGIFSAIPSPMLYGVPGLLAWGYSLYLLFTGVSIMMKSPMEKALPYSVILFVGSLVAYAGLGMASLILR